MLLVANGPMPTTAATVKVTTGTAIKTMLQLKPFNRFEIIEWGISFDGSAAALPIQVELIETGTIFGTVTASVDADIAHDPDDAVASIQGLTLGVSATGYTCTSEGSIVAVRNLDAPQLIAPTNQFIRQFVRRPKLTIGNAVRIRVTAGTAVNAYCWIRLG
jgi:hypothetical protein